MISEATKIARSVAYEDMTPEQKKIVCNQCGAKFGFKVPDFIFGECCNIHDYGYAKGGSEEDRKKEDNKFLDNMLKETRKKISYMVFTPFAYLYHLGVSCLKHNPCFAYEDKKDSKASL